MNEQMSPSNAYADEFFRMSTMLAAWASIYLLVAIAFMLLAFVATVLTVPSARNKADGGYDVDLFKISQWGLVWPLGLILFVRTTLVSLKEPWRHELLLGPARKAERDRHRASA